MSHRLCLALAMITALGCSAFGPSSRIGTDNPGVVDWSHGRFIPHEDPEINKIKPHNNKVYSPARKITVRQVRSLRKASPTKLNLSCCQLKAGVIKEVAGLTTLKWLNLAGTYGDDDSIEALSALELEILDLSGTKVSDSNLVAIAQISSLRVLKLNCTKCSVAGLQSLVALPHLEWLEVYAANVTEEDLQAFQEVKPGVFIYNMVDRGALYRGIDPYPE